MGQGERDSVASFFGDDSHRSLEDVHRSVGIRGGTWRRLFAFAGPAYMVAVGYMDPGNWATDIEGGARFGYSLIWVLLMSNLMAVLLQALSARLGLVTGRDLAQACRDSYNPLVRWLLFIFCEIAIAACDLAEVLGTALGINLLFHIPLVWAVLITGLDVFLLLAIQKAGIRKMEAMIVLLVMTIGACFVVEIFLSKPSAGGIASGFIPRPAILHDSQMLFVAIAILGATVMPHNLYLHSALVQSRDFERNPVGVRQAMRFNLVDTLIALNGAFFVNAAILIVAAATFFGHVEVTEIAQAHEMLDKLLGSHVAPAMFAIALICAGQSSTLTGTLAGQITMEGFLHFRMRPWLRRFITRSMAIVPALLVIFHTGDQGTYRLLIISQVILSLQLPFAVVPLVKFTTSRSRMGEFRTSTTLAVLAWTVAAIIIGLNSKLAYDQIIEWAAAAGPNRTAVLGIAVPSALALGGLLLWMIFRRDRINPAVAQVDEEAPLTTRAADVIAGAGQIRRAFARIGVALEAEPTDSIMLAEAIAAARRNHSELILIHVVEGVGGQYHGAQADDHERRDDERYMEQLAIQLAGDLSNDLPAIRSVLGYGGVTREIVRIAKAQKLDLLILGGHGHRGLWDLLRGTTIDGVRHRLSIPILAVRARPPEE